MHATINGNGNDIFNVLINDKSFEGILFEKYIILGLIANEFIPKY